MELFVVVLLLILGGRVSCRQLLQKPALGLEKNISCLLVFGDSIVDPGNNNYLETGMKANFPPYGIDFLDSRPTGRHSDGLLPGDLIAQKLGISSTIPAFLDYPKLTEGQLRQGVSFASAGAGFDETTGASQNVLQFSKQIELLRQYKIKLSRFIGSTKAEQTLEKALVIVSAGTDDFVENYLATTDRSKQFTAKEYVDFLISQLSKYIEEIHTIGAKRFVLTELGTIGCLPIVITKFGQGYCHPPLNDAARYFNSKQAYAAADLKKKLGINIIINRAYDVMYYATTTPGKFGFKIGDKGCCGNGTMDYGETCKGKALCNNPRSYIFFDAVHPSENMYTYIVEKLMEDLEKELMG